MVVLGPGLHMVDAPLTPAEFFRRTYLGKKNETFSDQFSRHLGGWGSHPN